MKRSSNFAIVVLSCDKYSDLWNPFFSLFKKHWADCPFTVYLGSNTVTYNDRSIQTVLSGPGVDWSTDLISILSKLKEEYVFIWLDDFFLTAEVNTKLFKECFEFAEKNKANHIHMMPVIKPDGVSFVDKRFGFYEKGAPYRSIVAGFWRKKHLQQLLIPGEDPWKFEIMGSYRSSYSDGYYTLMTQLFEFIRIVDKGKITMEAYEYIKKNKLPMKFSMLPVFSLQEIFINTIYTSIFNMMLRISWKKRLYAMEILRKLLISY